MLTDVAKLMSQDNQSCSRKLSEELVAYERLIGLIVFYTLNLVMLFKDYTV